LQSTSGHPRFGRFERIVWFAVGVGLAACSVGLFALVGYSLWQTLTWLQRSTTPSEQYVLNAVGLTTLAMLRYLAMLIGAALASGGLLVSFLTLSQAIDVSAKSGGASPTFASGLKTTSPGVAAVVIGAGIIVAALFSRTELQLSSSQTAQTTARATSLPMPSLDDLRSDSPSRNASAPGGGQ
jgi:hypothetical protein